MNRRKLSVAAAPFAGLLVGLLVTTGLLWAQTLEIPSGTTIKVRMIDKLNSEENQIGDTFRGTLDEPIQVNGRRALSQRGRRHRPSHRRAFHRPAERARGTGPGAEHGEFGNRGSFDLTCSRWRSKANPTPKVTPPRSAAERLWERSSALSPAEAKARLSVQSPGGAAGTGAAAATGKKPAIVDPEAVLTFVTSSASNPASNPTARPGPIAPQSPANASSTPPAVPPPGATGDAASGATAPPADSNQTTDDASTLFSLRDRRIIRSA